MRTKAARLLGGAIESGVLVLVCSAPWAFGATPIRFRFFLDVGLAGLMALWALRMILEGRSGWRWCPVAACLLALIVVAAGQLATIPRGLLRWVSPATARMYDRTLPDRPEVLPGDSLADPSVDPAPPAGSSLSFDRGATRRELGRLLAVFLLFAVVRGNVDPASGLRRLALAALVNGSLLALFGIVQAFSSSPKLIYWSYSTAGSPFGPFINRNHFAFYVNVCIGLGIGLLLGRARAVEGRGGGPRIRLAADLLLDPSALGIVFATGLMISGVLASLSRGGSLALLGGFLSGLALWVARARGGGRSIGGWVLLPGPLVALALVAWFGTDQIANRLATLQNGEALSDLRPAIWSRAFRVIRDYPLWGTGSGTYEFADMLHRSAAVDADVIVDHAHNDYLELLVEGGLALFVPGVLALVLTFRRGLRAAARLGDTPSGWLATGALISLATVTIHGFVDFGMHIPSCAALVVVLAALLSGLSVEDREPDGNRPPIWRRGLATILGAGLALALGFVVAREGWRPYQAQRLQDRASALDQSGDPSRLDRKVDLLEAAARVLPEDFLRREDLFAAHLNAFEQEVFERARVHPASPDDLGRPRREHLIPALRNLRRCRDLCPLRALVQMEIAEHLGGFEAADPREAYLERAKLLAPGDPEVWYESGVYELEDGRVDQAWASWRHALGLSGQRLPEILDRVASRLEPRAILDRVLPEDPDRLLEASERLPAGSEGRRIVLESALGLLGRRPGPATAEGDHLKGTVLRALGRLDEALEAYRSALLREPLRRDWRFERAEVASDRGQFEEARQELLMILGLNPEDARARALLEEVTRKAAEGR